MGIRVLNFHNLDTGYRRAVILCAKLHLTSNFIAVVLLKT